jgi:iron complex transport system substrate-binding protein
MINNLNARLHAPVLILSLLLIGLNVGVAASEEVAGYPREIVDSAGRTIVLQMPTERIIVLNSDAAEAVNILGASDKIVGVVDTIKKKADYFPNLLDKQSIGKWNAPDYEMIGEIARSGDSVRPNIIVICYTYPDKPYGVNAVEKGLAPFEGVAVVGLDFYKPENMTREIALLGSILGREDAAANYIGWYEEKTGSVRNAVDGLSMPKVYLERTSTGGIGALDTYGSGSGLNDLARIAGGYNIAKGLTENSPKVPWEWVVTKNPDIIIRIQSAETIGWPKPPSKESVSLASIRNEILNRPGASSVSAVKNDRVYVVYWDMCYGMDSVVGLTALAKLFHPQTSLDPKEVYSEYLARIGLKYPDNREMTYPSIQDSAQ